MKRIYGNIAILILAAALTAACTNVLDSPQVKGEAETGRVYIVIDGNSAGKRAEARTLAPALNITRYRASFSGPEPQADMEITGENAWVNLAPGEWTITVTAFTGTDTDIGWGSAEEVEVLSGQTVTADITIIPITGSGRNGDFRYSVTIPSVDSAVLSLTNMTTNTAAGTPVDLKTAADNSSGTAAATLNLDAGYYLMNIYLEKNGTYAGRTEVVHIYNGLETGAVYAFTDSDFGAVVGTLTGGVWQDGEIIVYDFEYYRFPVTMGETYAVYWNDSYSGGGTKTLDIKVSAYYETSKASIFSGEDSGYHTPKVFTAASSDNVIIRVEPYYGGSTGTYAVMYATPTYGIDLDATGTHIFPAAITGYGTQTAKTVTITNTGNQPTGALTIALSGADSGSFTLSKTLISGIAVGGTDSFTVVPKIWHGAGTYTATVTVSGSGITATFDVSFTVIAATWDVNLDVTGTHTFPALVVGYGAQTAKSVTVTNTGNQPTGALTIVLLGANPGSFTLSKTSISDVAVGETDSFTVVPNTGLAAGTYTATVEVDGTAINEIFDVSFTVGNPATTIGITVWENEDGNILASNDDVTISKSGSGGSTSFTAGVTGAYSGVQWHLNGDPIYGSRGTAQSITINAKDYTNGTYYLGVSVSKGGLPYSTVIHFTVIN